MKVLRTAALIAVCLGLMLPSAHALALCIDSDGSLALEVAVDGACGGAKTRNHKTARQQAEGASFMATAVSGCGACTDVVLRGSGAVVPLPDASDRSRHLRATDETAIPVDPFVESRPGGCSSAGSSSSTPIVELPDTRGSAVLRL